jgi:23S rRNA (guanosine2251-2'-O)-methyltransferase
MKGRKQGLGSASHAGDQIHTVTRAKRRTLPEKPEFKHRSKMQQPGLNKGRTPVQPDYAKPAAPARPERHKSVARRKSEQTHKPVAQVRTGQPQVLAREKTLPAKTRLQRPAQHQEIRPASPVSVVQTETAVTPNMPSEGTFGGRNAVMEALRSGRPLNKLYVQEGLQGGSLGEILHQAKEAGIMVEYVKPEKLHTLLPGIKHQGVAAVAAPVAFSSLEKVLEKARSRGEAPFLLLLDELQDPQNVGALIRTADAAGVHGVLLPVRHSCPLNAVVAKTSAGAVEYVPVVQIGNVTQTLQKLKEQGFWVVGADMSGNICYEADLTGPIVVVVGAEGKGLGRLVRESCDILVRLPMFGGVNSLNAGAAGAVLLYEVVRQRLARNR